MRKNIVSAYMMYAAVAACITVAFPASAGVVLDDFNRPDTATTTTNGAIIGENWTVSSGANGVGTWSIKNEQLSAKAANLGMLVNTAATTSGRFTVSTDLSYDKYNTASSLWAGILFGYIDSTNYYMLRIKAVSESEQDIQIAYNDGSGEVQTGLSGDKTKIVNTLTAGGVYTFKVEYDSANTITWTITPVGGTAISGVVTIGTSARQIDGGIAGVFLRSNNRSIYTFDNFTSTDNIPEPSAIGLSLLGAMLAWPFTHRRCMF